MFADFDRYETIEYLISREEGLIEINSLGAFSDTIALYTYLFEFVVACVDFSGADCGEEAPPG